MKELARTNFEMHNAVNYTYLLPKTSIIFCTRIVNIHVHALHN